MLHLLRPTPGSKRPRKRSARGNSAGGGTTAGRGTKGQQSRTGKGRRFGFEGGQVPLLRRQPKIGGFKSPLRVAYQVVNLRDLERLGAGTYDVAGLAEHRLVDRSRRIKVLGTGKLTKALHLTVHAASKTARKAITDTGGSINILS